MFDTIIQALYFMFPAYLGTIAPVFLCKFKLLEFLNVPVDFNRKLDGEPLFGKTKTWRGIFGGAIAGMLMIFIQALILEKAPVLAPLYLLQYQLPSVLWLGFLQGLGVGLMDLLKSFFKRRLGIPSSAPFRPYDQLDFVGGIILGSLFFQLPAGHLAAILIISPALSFGMSWIGLRIRWKKSV